MKKYTVNINNFTLGEKSHLGVESTFISGGAKQLINFIPGHNNVLMRRPGSKHIKNFTVEDSENIKLFTIEINNSIYLLEFVLGKLRIYKDNVLLMNEGNSEIETPYVHAEHLKCLNITIGYTSYETLFFCKYLPPYVLVIDIFRDVFSLKQIFFTDGPYENINTTNISLTPQKLSGENINIKASEPLFYVSDLGLYLRLYDEKTKVWGWGIITKVIDSTQVQVNIKSNFTSYLPTLIWCKGIFNKSKGYPSLGIIFNSRLYVAYTLCDTTTVWASCYNDYLNFAPSEIQNPPNFVDKNDNSFAYKYSITFTSSEIKEILWLKSTPYYVIAGSKEGIFAFMPLDYNKPLSTCNFIVQKLSELGSNGKLVGNNQYIIYENLKNNINILEYDSNSLTPNIVENVLETPNQFKEKTSIHYLVLTNFYENIVSIILSNGKIIFLNINKINKETLYAFSQGILGGSKIKIKYATGYNNYLYLIVERFINQKYYVTLEYINWLELNLALEDNFSIENNYYLDCLEISNSELPLTYVSIKANMPTAIIADDCYLGEFCNKEGMVILQKPAKKIIQGYNYLSIYQSGCLNNLNLDYNLSGYKKLFKITINFINSLGGELESNHYITKNLALTYLKDIKKKFCTGYRTFNINSIYFNEITFKIVQNIPFPLNFNLIKVEILVK